METILIICTILGGLTAVHQIYKNRTAIWGTVSRVLTERISSKKEGIPSFKKLTRMASKLQLRKNWIFQEINFDQIEIIEILAQTDHSIIQKCRIHDTYYVLKGTKQFECDFDTLQALIDIEIKHIEINTALSIVTPFAVWISDQYVWELIEFIEGITLYEVIERNKYNIAGDYLAVIQNCLFKAISQLHSYGILHRDITPNNLLIKEFGDLYLIDCSFACEEKSSQKPITNKLFTAPEQESGHACIVSDWYSIAATIYYLSNKTTPSRRSKEDRKKGYKNINYGLYASRESIENLFESLLDSDPLNRPKELYEVILRGLSHSLRLSYDIVSVLKVGEIGYLILEDNRFRFAAEKDASKYLEIAKKNNDSLPIEMSKDIERFLNKENPWYKGRISPK